ncbi:MAG TPA: PPC domain-containing DNA-binding protein [Patescibacteria group bacterium]|nr:PPC domain-containing DNA-binding protein [Patescibacteria group bacterium]
MIKIEVRKGEEVVETVTAYLTKHDIKTGVIVSVIGALNEFSLSSMDKHDEKKVITTEYTEAVELSGNGEITDGKPHFHVTLGREDQQALHGHLEWGKVNEWFVHVYIMPLN